MYHIIYQYNLIYYIINSMFVTYHESNIEQDTIYVSSVNTIYSIHMNDIKYVHVHVFASRVLS